MRKKSVGWAPLPGVQAGGPAWRARGRAARPSPWLGRHYPTPLQGYDKGKVIVYVEDINEFNRVFPRRYVKVILLIPYHKYVSSYEKHHLQQDPSLNPHKHSLLSSSLDDYSLELLPHSYVDLIFGGTPVRSSVCKPKGLDQFFDTLRVLEPDSLAYLTRTAWREGRLRPGPPPSSAKSPGAVAYNIFPRPSSRRVLYSESNSRRAGYTRGGAVADLAGKARRRVAVARQISTTTISCLTGKQPVGFGCEVVRRRRRRTETRSGHGAPTLDLMSWALLRAARDLKSNRFDMLSQAIRPVLVDWHNNRHSTRTHRED
ncbi:hypothetical protein U9M48_031538 [Paspalum notatum var. saurae]|uniref:Uncharacterized protein n=1 Tax=Paspalum notatum var. saurae TaxID=547442 RepID=A0AAQ3U2S3_PASNO